MKAKGIRLNRYLSLCGIASRRKCEQLILDQRISINGKTVTELSTLVQNNDIVTLDGQKITAEQLTYILMNKPRSVITTLSDERNRKHVGLLLPGNLFVKPVGRLDRNTTGVLLFTNDGELHYRLTHPKYQIPRRYKVTLDRLFPEKLRDTIRQGVRLNHRQTAHATVMSVRHLKQYSVIILELQEGLNREIHRMFKVLGYRVVELDRISYAGLGVGDLKQGSWRYLSTREVQSLKRKCELV